MNVALLFPGQGSQYVGMGKSLAENFLESKQVFERVDEALGENLSKLIWDGSEEVLKQTQNAQPALMATSMAAIEAARAVGFDFGNVRYVAGHSLGEYSALCCSGAMSLEDTAIILSKRGKAMQSAVKSGEGAMAAIIGISLEEVKEAISNILDHGVCEVANDNEPKQIVISGHKKKVEKALEILKAIGARRAILLPVSAPFHCSLMEPAVTELEGSILDLKLSNLNIPIVSNVTAKEMLGPKEVKISLIKQITYPVRWRESISYLSVKGINRFIEFGAGKVLSGLVKRILEDPMILNIGEFSDLEKLREE